MSKYRKWGSMRNCASIVQLVKDNYSWRGVESGMPTADCPKRKSSIFQRLRPGNLVEYRPGSSPVILKDERWFGYIVKVALQRNWASYPGKASPSVWHGAFCMSGN